MYNINNHVDGFANGDLEEGEDDDDGELLNRVQVHWTVD